MFSREDAISFIQNSWGVERVDDRFHSDKKGLLEEVIVLIQTKVPFQSITLMATPPAERRRPDLATIIEECKSGVGGLCYNLNVFAWALLKGLGFSAQLSPATCTSTVSSPNNHVIVLVKDLEKKGDIHLVECGCGFPTFHAISLDFKEETPVYVDSFLEYKYIRHGDQFLRMHGKGDQVKRNDPPVENLDFFIGKWRRFLYFSIQPTDALSDFDAVFDRVFTQPYATPFDHSPRALCFPGQRAIILVNNRQMVELESGQLQTTILDGDEHIVDSYLRYFPVFQEDTVRRALQQWHVMQNETTEKIRGSAKPLH